MRLLRAVIAACLWSICAPSFAAEPLPFYQDSLNEIEAAYAGQPFLLSVWSLECAPCLKELPSLGALAAEFPKLNLVLLSTDGLEYAEDVDSFLNSANLKGVPSWIYASGQAERLRFSVDPNWYGEMPRAYFYAPDGSRQAVSGLLPEALLREWAASSVVER